MEINRNNKIHCYLIFKIKFNVYIVVKGTTNVADANNNAYDQKLAFKNSASFISCISKINNTLADNAEDLDI